MGAAAWRGRAPAGGVVATAAGRGALRRFDPPLRTDQAPSGFLPCAAGEGVVTGYVPEDEEAQSRPSWLYLDRVAGGHCDYCNSGGAAAAGPVPGQGAGPNHLLPEQHETVDPLLAHVSRGSQRAAGSQLDLTGQRLAAAGILGFGRRSDTSRVHERLFCSELQAVPLQPVAWDLQMPQFDRGGAGGRACRVVGRFR